MKLDIRQVATVAVAVATEAATFADSDVLQALIGDLPDDCDVTLFSALVTVYREQGEKHGPEALQRAALGWARRSCGLES